MKFWLFDGLRRYLRKQATWTYDHGSAGYESFLGSCKSENAAGPPQVTGRVDEQVESKLRVEFYRAGPYAIQKRHAWARNVRSGRVVRDARTIRVTGPPRKLDVGRRLALVSAVSVLTLHMGLLSSAYIVNTSVWNVYAGLPDGLPSADERVEYSTCRLEPLVEQVSVCRDGWISRSTGQGTCSWHGGVSHRDELITERTRRDCARALIEKRAR